MCAVDEGGRVVPTEIYRGAWKWLCRPWPARRPSDLLLIVQDVAEHARELVGRDHAGDLGRGRRRHSRLPSLHRDSLPYYIKRRHRVRRNGRTPTLVFGGSAEEAGFVPLGPAKGFGFVSIKGVPG